MNNTGQKSEKAGYRVVLLLAVALAAFSSAMKELNQIQQLTLDVNHLLAQWSNRVAPTETPLTAVRIETCDASKSVQQALPSAELPWLAHTGEEEKTIDIEDVEKSIEAVEPARSAKVIRIRKAPRSDLNPVQLEMRIAADHDGDSDGTIVTELPVSLFKTKNPQAECYQNQSSRS